MKLPCLVIWASCVSLVVTQEFLLVSSRDAGIYKVDLKTKAKTRLPLPFSESPFSVTYDPMTARVIWWDYKVIRIASAQLDGKEYIIHRNTTRANGYGKIYYMDYFMTEQMLVYNQCGTVRSLDFRRRLPLRTVVAARYDSQVAYDVAKRVTFFIKSDNSVASKHEDDTTVKTFFRPNFGIHMYGITLGADGGAIYSCGFSGDLHAYSTDVSYLYKYDIATGTIIALGTRQNFRCYRLVTDGQNLFFADYYSRVILEMPLTKDLASATLISSGYTGRVYDLEYVNTTTECMKKLRSFQERIPDNAVGGDLVASVPISPRLKCRITGDRDSTAMFDVATRNGSCQVFVKAGQTLSSKKKLSYNIQLELNGMCPWLTPDVASLVLEVYPGAGCQALPESSPAGTVALEVPITYPGQPRPLKAVLLEDTRGQPQYFAVKSPVMHNSTNGTVTATAQVVLTKPIDLEKPGSRLHSFSLQLDYCVEVTDANDNAPEFLFPDGKPVWMVNWKEGTRGTLATASAKDSDRGKFGTVGLRFSIAHDPTGGSFSIDAKTGAIETVKDLDKESLGSYVALAIKVMDNEGIPPFKDAITVLHIKLTDVNDNKPRFSKTKYTANILEVMFDGSVVKEVKATDADEEKNAEIVYSLTSANPVPFVIEPNTGRIKVSGKLMGRVGTYHLSVTATDRGTPPLSSTAAVVINVRGIRSLPGRKRRDALLLARIQANPGAPA